MCEFGSRHTSKENHSKSRLKFKSQQKKWMYLMRIIEGNRDLAMG
jgi:hypothetical protein